MKCLRTLLLSLHLCRAPIANVISAVGAEIGSYYHPVDILLNLNSSLCEPYEQLRQAGGFHTLLEALSDFWQYNEPELSAVTKHFSDLTLIFSEDPDPESLDIIRTVINHYLLGLHLTVWKYLPLGMRSSYTDYFTDIPDYYVIPDSGKTRTVNGITVPVICELPLETSQAFHSVRQVDSTLTFIRTRRWPFTTRVAVRCVDMCRSKAADMNIPGSSGIPLDYSLRLTPSRRIALELSNGDLRLWRGDSTEPVLVASHVKFFDYVITQRMQILIRLSVLLRGELDNFTVIFPLDLKKQILAEELDTLHARFPFTLVSSFPTKPCTFDLWIIPRLVGGWDLVDISKVRLLDFFSAIASDCVGTHPRQILLHAIFENLKDYAVTGDLEKRETAWAQIQRFIENKPYESYRLRFLVAQTIRGDFNYFILR